jgi:hypothetical protein
VLVHALPALAEAVFLLGGDGLGEALFAQQGEAEAVGLVPLRERLRTGRPESPRPFHRGRVHERPGRLH